MMVALNKNGVSALHLAVPTTARSLNQSQGKHFSYIFILTFCAWLHLLPIMIFFFAYRWLCKCSAPKEYETSPYFPVP